MTSQYKNQKQARLDTINQLIQFISERGRRFFYRPENYETKQPQVAYMKLINGRVYYIDDYTNKAILAYDTNREHTGFSHGGTLWALVCDFALYIRTGDDTDGVHGYRGLYADGWGHSDEIQQEIIDFAKKIGYLK